MASIPAIGTRWRRRPPGREVVIVRRVWYDHQGWAVRAHPVRGGKVLIADAHWFTTEGYEPAERGAA